MSAPGKRVNMCLTLREKVDIINAIDNGATRKKVMSEYRVPASTLSCIIRHRDQLLKRMEERATNPSSKRIRAVESPELEEKMKEFVSECRRNGDALTGNLILSKAREFAGELGLTTFRASNGWLYNFKKRQGFPSRRSKPMIDSPKTDSTKAKHSEERDTEDNEQAKPTSESHQEEYNPINDEDLIAVDVTSHERDALKLEALDTDDDQQDNNDIAIDFVNAKDFDDAVDFNDSTEQNDTRVSTTEAGKAGGCPRGIEDEFSCFGRYIAQALRAMPPRMSVLARSELQAALARVQMKCFDMKTDR
ncbi:major centromere autoantigen B-like isoform X3 [Aricia agestis]|uniref:major centromere autoantigen B-like isoform X3 n=1 Tax=Aricia agestis TaxID=91739 RepID=UPI001C208FBF|nr:major centromere autoantigen B-like isoform X3 [Aricia agestis]XP_041982104.1 major centromere autoantigen B-like isoform X3 [Aricia agestis]